MNYFDVMISNADADDGYETLGALDAYLIEMMFVNILVHI